MSNAESSVSVLCVDDEPGMADLIGTYLERFDDGLSTTAATSAEAALETFDADEYDCIVSDYDMPGMDGLEFLATLRAEHPEFPFILFTGRGSEEIASEAVSAGVSDYMQKEQGTDQYEVLATRIRNIVSRRRYRTQAATAKEHAETILHATPNAVFVSIDDRIVYTNPAAVELSQSFSVDDLRDRSLSSFLQPVDRDATVFEHIQNGDSSLEYERFSLDTPTGPVPVEGSARQIMWNDSPAVVCVLQDISERIEYEQELTYQQSLLDTTFEVSPDGILITTDDWEVLSYNDQFIEMWGLSQDIFDTGDSKPALDAVLDDIEDADSFVESIEWQFEHPDETRREQVSLTDGRVFEQYSAPIRPNEGTHHGFVWFYRDITELSRLQQAQADAFDRMTDAVYAVDTDWNFTFINEQASELVQRDPDDLLGTNIWDEFPEAADSELAEHYYEAMATGEPVTFEFYYEPLGTEFEIRVFPSDSGLTVYFRDITEQRRTESELEQGVETLHALYEISSDTGMSFDEKRRELLEFGCEFLDLPHGFITEITETRQTIIASVGDHELLQPGEACPLEQSYCRKTIATESGFLAVRNAGEEGWTEDPAYETFELETYIGGKIVVDGELYGTVCFASDHPRDEEFSELEWTFVELLSRWLSYEFEQLEARTELEDQNARLEEFAGIVSHDLRNPLSVATGYLEMAMEDEDTAPLAHVEQAHTRMQELIEDILLLAQEGDVIGDLTDVSLPDICESAWANVETADATLDVETEHQLIADESRLTQLFENLFRNAVEHGGPDVTIRIGDLADGFYVAITGVGIPEQEQSTLFEAGYSTKEGGTGIGLRVVKQIVDAHGWEIHATDGPEGGARFEISGVEFTE